MHHFNPQSKVWVYTASRAFTNEEAARINSLLYTFTQQWTAHNQQLKATGEVRHNRFVVLMVDETEANASGCSIDKSVHFLKQLEAEFGIELFNRQLVGYNDNGTVKTFELPQIDQLFEAGTIDTNTTVYNNIVTTKQAFDAGWETALSNSWLAKFIPTQKTTS